METTNPVFPTHPRPIVVVGKEEKVVKMVSAKLLPEYEGTEKLNVLVVWY